MLTRHCISHLMPPYFLPLLCTFADESNASWLLKHDKSEGDWKKSHSSKSWSWQLFFCSVAHRWVCCLCWLRVHFEVHVTCSCTRFVGLKLQSSATVCCRQTCRHFLSSPSLSPLVSYVSILLLTFIHRFMLTANIILCHSAITLLVGFRTSANEIILSPG